MIECPKCKHIMIYEETEFNQFEMYWEEIYLCDNCGTVKLVPLPKDYEPSWERMEG